jgi:hypothetical protein
MHGFGFQDVCTLVGLAGIRCEVYWTAWSTSEIYTNCNMIPADSTRRPLAQSESFFG